MQQMNNPNIKSNTPIILAIIGSAILFVSLFLPYLTISVLGSTASIDGTSSPLGFILIIGAIGLSVWSAIKYNGSHFREDFSTAKTLTILSAIAGFLGIGLYVLSYQATINYIKTAYGVDASGIINFGIGFYGICLGTIVAGSAFFKISSIVNYYPSKWINRPMFVNYGSPIQQAPNIASNQPYTNNQGPVPQFMPQQQVNVPQQTPNETHLYCPNCGTQIPSNSNFCPNCGFKRK